MKKVLLIGDSCIDKYIFGEVNRLSPEAPIPVLSYKETTKLKGMAHNVQNNLEAFDLDVDFITQPEEIIKTRYIDVKSNSQLLRLDEDVKCKPYNNVESIDFDLYDVVVISDYNKGFLTYENMVNIIDCANESSKKVFIDTKKPDLEKFEGAVIKVNETEYNNAISYCSDIITTLGSKGAEFNSEYFYVREVDVYDVCGAGDTFIAALVYKWLHTKDMSKAIDFANIAASITVQNFGVYSPTKEEIKGIESEKITRYTNKT